MTDKQRYYAKNKDEINRRRKELRRNPEQRAKDNAYKRAWRAKNRAEYKLICCLGVRVGAARKMISAIQ